MPTVAYGVRIYRLRDLSPRLQAQLRAGQHEAAQVWNLCRDLHQQARQTHEMWPGRKELQRATKGRFALHSQSIQMVTHAFLANIAATRDLRRQGHTRMRYPWRDKEFYPIHWPAQATCRQEGRVLLPMGRGRPSLVLPVDLPENAGACTLVWKDGYELHVAATTVCAAANAPAASGHACIDLGQIHQAAVVTDTGAALVISGRGIRSVKRQRNMQLGEIARKRARCQKGSRRWHKLGRARAKLSARAERRLRNLQHQGTHDVAEFCQAEGIGQVFIGDPAGVQHKTAGRKHNQRMSQWEFGRDKKYLQEKLERVGITSFTGSERGTSSRCPRCGAKRKPHGRTFTCPNTACLFVGHRDIVGGMNMHPLAFGRMIEYPARHTYRLPCPTGPGRRSRLDAGQSCPSRIHSATTHSE